jgi:diguanylate cyclase
LTRLPNRASILSRLESSVADARIHGTPVCVALIDLDHFKSINDTLGHLAGDEVLRESAQRLAGAIRESDFVGRYGGEEFIIVFNNMELESGEARCELVRRALCGRSIPWENQELTITCSIGVVAAHASGLIVPALVAIADQAMYEAKRQGRNCVVAVRQRSATVNPLPGPSTSKRSFLKPTLRSS